MAVVLPSEESSYFSSGGLRRSHSQSQFSLDGTSSNFQLSKSNPQTKDSHHSTTRPQSHSELSSASSSPRPSHTESTDLSYASTPSSNLSFASDFDETTLAFDDSLEEEEEEDTDDELGIFPLKKDRVYGPPPVNPDGNLEPPPSPKYNESNTPSPADNGNIRETLTLDTPEFPDHAEDDTAVTIRPSRQVDYLSHDWREEDIWSSWRYIVSRRGEYANSERLENASWRTWMKSKNSLKTISPETLNWLKECDVTWLYGPLNPHTPATHELPSPKNADSCMGLEKKPILKKRSMSEVMLQRSLSTASLLKQATAAVQAQETKGILRPSLNRFHTDYVTYPFAPSRMSQEPSSSAVSTTESSGITSPNGERRHIHFNEQVEQCIAVEIKGEEDDEIYFNGPSYDSDSDDGVVMKRTRRSISRTRTNAMILRKQAKKKAPAECAKTIAILPSTTLKYRSDTPDTQETAMKHSRSPIVSPSSSQETLRPSSIDRRLLVTEDGDDVADGFCDPEAGWRSSIMNDSFGGGGGLKRSASSSSLADQPGMRRTPSGMLMPLETTDADRQAGNDGIFGRVVETVNTARDIAHVIWNVGWRK